ncbi:MAG: HupE/UreJ family protein [Methylococcales bacterium]|nr:HupE/UreJ family protein [Methylococcales bacterium]
MSNRPRLFAGFLKWPLAVLLLLQSAWAVAHSPGLSSMELSIKADSLNVKVTFALQDIEAFAPMDTDLDAEVSNAERDAAKPSIARLIAGQMRITVDGQAISPSEPGQVSFDDQNNAHVELHYPAAPKQSLLLQSSFLALLPDGHQQYVTIRDSKGRILSEKMLSRQDDQIRLQIGSGGADQTKAAQPRLNVFVDFLKLGIEHILTGYDHLLFLFGLLAVTHSFWPAIKVITFFTIAHSITLACAGLNIVELPSSFVEPFIAATIIYVGVENVIRGDHPKGRNWLTFGFGLIHGFGFAGVLREMEISSGDSGFLLPLLSFNLGIETGQIAVASIVLPCIWWLNSKPAVSRKFLKAGSILVSLMGTYWLLERTIL